MWCKAIDNYAKVAKVVEPKKKKVQELQVKLNFKMKVKISFFIIQDLQAKQESLDRVKDRVRTLEKECQETVNFKEQLESDIEKTKNRLVAAEKLNNLLADEGERWKGQLKQIESDQKELIGNIFLSSSIISYCGGFTIFYSYFL